MANITGWGRGTWSEGDWGEFIPVSVTGVSATISLPNITDGLTLSNTYQSITNLGSIPNRGQDVVFQSDSNGILLKSSYTDAEIWWDIGGTGAGAWSGIAKINNDYFIRFRTGSGSTSNQTTGGGTAGGSNSRAIVNLSVSDSSVASYFDDERHIITWAIEVPNATYLAGRLRLWIDGNEVITYDPYNDDGNVLRSGQWAGSDSSGYGQGYSQIAGTDTTYDSGATQYQTFTGSSVGSDVYLYAYENQTISQLPIVVNGSALVTPTGVSSGAVLGTAIGVAESIYPVTGVQSNTATGTVSLSIDQIISVTGLQANSAVATPDIAAGGNITVNAPADQMDFAIGSVIAESEAIIPIPAGVSMEIDLPGILGEFTTEGSTALSTDEAKFGVSSVEFDGTSGQGVQQNIASGFGSGDFTSEFWIYSSSIRSQSCTLWDFRISGLGLLLTNLNGQISFFKDGAGGSSPTSILTNDTWHHIAIVRSGSTGNVYVDGNLQITRTIGTDDYSSHTVLLGNNVFDTSGYLSGYIDEYRNSNIVRYSSNFTPPTSAFTPDANTTALLHFDGADGSIEIVNSAVGEPIVIESAYSLTGSQSNTSVGTTTIESAYTLTGEEIDTEIGTPTFVGNALVEPTAVTMQFADGTATAIISAVAEVTGLSMAFTDGTAIATGTAIVIPTSLNATVSLGNMRSTPWANVVPGVSDSWTNVNTNASNTWTEVAA